MKRVLMAGCLVLFLGSCQVPPERVPLQRLPENGPPLPYAELLTRARGQATVATEAFYVNHWTEMEDAARALEQTARFLARAEDVPANRKEQLPAASSDLSKEAMKLQQAATSQNVEAATTALQRIHVMVRELRLAN
jgi:hypothetical protein